MYLNEFPSKNSHLSISYVGEFIWHCVPSRFEQLFFFCRYLRIFFTYILFMKRIFNYKHWIYYFQGKSGWKNKLFPKNKYTFQLYSQCFKMFSFCERIFQLCFFFYDYILGACQKNSLCNLICPMITQN